MHRAAGHPSSKYIGTIQYFAGEEQSAWLQLLMDLAQPNLKQRSKGAQHTHLVLSRRGSPMTVGAQSEWWAGVTQKHAAGEG